VFTGGVTSRYFHPLNSTTGNPPKGSSTIILKSLGSIEENYSDAM